MVKLVDIQPVFRGAYPQALAVFYLARTTRLAWIGSIERTQGFCLRNEAGNLATSARAISFDSKGPETTTNQGFPLYSVR